MGDARVGLLLGLLFMGPALAAAETKADPPLLLRSPSLSQDRIAFRYADDIWTVPRQGGEAQRLTSNGHVVAGPYSRPTVRRSHTRHTCEAMTTCTSCRRTGAFRAESPGTPPAAIVVGWSRDGKNVLIASGMSSYRHFVRLFLVHTDGSGIPEPLPAAHGHSKARFSPDGQSIAYEPITKWQEAWKRYMGGQTTPIWIVNLKTLDLVRVPRENSNDSSPVWQGDAVYFLSDRGEARARFPSSNTTCARKQVTPVGRQQGPGSQVGAGRSRRPGIRAVRLHPLRGHGHAMRTRRRSHPDPWRTPRSGAAHRHHSARGNSERRLSRPAGPARYLRPTEKSSLSPARRATRAT